LKGRLKRELRQSSVDASGTLTVSMDRAEAIARTAAHYDGLFGGAPAMHALRSQYAMAEVTVPDAIRRQKLTAFFFWTSWASAANRPGSNVTFTNNWPHEPLIDNVPSSANVLWSIISVVLLLTGIGALVWWQAFRQAPESQVVPAGRDPFLDIRPTPSMRAVGKYLGVVVLLLIVQVSLGAITAHYTVEGQTFFGFPLAQYLPYSLARTWHVQTGLFWIATAFLAAGLFLAPIVGGQEPRFQRLGVNVLFGALLLVVGGSLAGEALSIHQRLGLDTGFWFGSQGYEYVDLGRAWQIALFAAVALIIGVKRYRRTLD
jgi:nitric oxide reductase subunit B